MFESVVPYVAEHVSKQPAGQPGPQWAAGVYVMYGLEATMGSWQREKGRLLKRASIGKRSLGGMMKKAVIGGYCAAAENFNAVKWLVFIPKRLVTIHHVYPGC